MSDKPISPLRQRMIDDMTARRFTEDTKRDYVRNVRMFAAFLGRSPDTATKEDLRRFQPYCIWRGSRSAQGRSTPPSPRCDARTARPRSPSDDREQAAQGAGRAEPGGGGASARSRARPEVQGRAQRRLRRGSARVRGREPEGVRYLPVPQRPDALEASETAVAWCRSQSSLGGRTRDRSMNRNVWLGEGFRTPAPCGTVVRVVGPAFESLPRRKPRGCRGAVWSGATYGDFRIADGSRVSPRGPVARNLGGGNDDDERVRSRGCAALARARRSGED